MRTEMTRENASIDQRVRLQRNVIGMADDPELSRKTFTSNSRSTSMLQHGTQVQSQAEYKIGLQITKKKKDSI